MSEPPVIIIGAGVVGLVLAQSLKKVSNTLPVIHRFNAEKLSRMEYRSSFLTETSTSTFVVMAGVLQFTGR
jgi:2-polyprenyl-6-methoxyphenol hydroxylase-like FAD-dependent oxidoreductase